MLKSQIKQFQLEIQPKSSSTCCGKSANQVNKRVQYSSENRPMTSTPSAGQNQNIEIINVISYIADEQLKTKLDTNFT